LKENALLANQLDFIFFFYGLAFILLGAICWTIARSKGRDSAWAALGGFGFVHGICEWLDLAALIVGDAPAFAATRIGLMAASFVLLLEFARLEAWRLGTRVPGRWIYVPLLLLVALVGVFHGIAAAGIAARYAIGLVGAAAASIVLMRVANNLANSARRYAILAAGGFGLYAICAGLIVPAAPFWPASVVNHGTFAAVTHVPIQLVRGVLACGISFSIWAIWTEERAAEVSSTRYTAYVRDQFNWTLVAMGAILVSGWTLTEYLGGIYRHNVQEQAAGDIELLASRLAGESALVDGMVTALAGSPSILPLLLGGDPVEEDVAQSVLDLDIEAAGAKHGFILDASGTVIASSNRLEAHPHTSSFASSAYFRKAIAGGAGRHYEFDPSSSRPVYYSSRPIRTRNSRVVGVAVLAKSLDSFEADLRQFDRPYFLVDRDGVVLLTNRTDAQFRTLWPLGAAAKAALARKYRQLVDRPMLQREVSDASWIEVGGERNYVRRRFADQGGWSLVVLKPTREIFASRFLGIVITLLVTMMALIYLIGRGRWVHDDVQASHRVRLQELAQDLGIKATTDPLTGLHNRLMLEHTLPAELARAERYETALSIVLYDIDHFKRVNDTHGHAAGDQVLIKLSRFVPNLIRNSDLLVRWGGEEFLILMPGSEGAMACRAAEKLRDAISHVEFAEVGSVTCSFGVAQYQPGDTADSLIARADVALYQAKHSGRNQVRMMPAPDSTPGPSSTDTR
jgi:diguanylate cyclase (GGDEF)-like protein